MRFVRILAHAVFQQVYVVVNLNFFYKERNWNSHSLLSGLILRVVTVKVQNVIFFLVLQSGNVPSSLGVDKAEKKLQENEELMKRLTGIWEDKWSKTQKLIEVKWSPF